MKTKELRKVVQTQLKTIVPRVAFRQIADNTQFPYVTYEFSSINLSDISRELYDLCIDIFTNGIDTKTIDDYADSIENLFQCSNQPNASILPTFFKESRLYITEEDKRIQHIQLHFSIYNYSKII